MPWNYREKPEQTGVISKWPPNGHPSAQNRIWFSASDETSRECSALEGAIFAVLR
jgi:hypothetical protein